MTTEKSGTPRTDAEIQSSGFNAKNLCVGCDFARQLEGELAAANARNESLARCAALATDHADKLVEQLAEATNQIGEFRTREADASDCFAEMWKQRDEAREIACHLEICGECALDMNGCERGGREYAKVIQSWNVE